MFPVLGAAVAIVAGSFVVAARLAPTAAAKSDLDALCDRHTDVRLHSQGGDGERSSVTVRIDWECRDGLEYVNGVLDDVDCDHVGALMKVEFLTPDGDVFPRYTVHDADGCKSKPTDFALATKVLSKEPANLNGPNPPVRILLYTDNVGEKPQSCWPSNACS